MVAGCTDPAACDADPTDGMPALGSPANHVTEVLATDAGLFFVLEPNLEQAASTYLCESNNITAEASENSFSRFCACK